MVTPSSCSAVSETSTESGTMSPMARALRQSPRKSRITSSERMPPSTISWVRLPRASLTKRACAATSRSRNAGNSSPSWAMAASRSRVTATVLAPASL